MSFVVTRGGTVGRVVRRYQNLDGKPMVVVQWGHLGWMSPVFEEDTHALVGWYESERKVEAEAWLTAG